jgi:predicted TIM-barrel fold metal-dependent hydrolase
MIEIFDSLTHPTINNLWLNPRFNNCCDVRLLQEEMNKYKIFKSFAVGLRGVGGYSIEEYIKFIQLYQNLIPVAFCEIDYSKKELEEIKRLGYKGIKIHPRISDIALDDDRIFFLIKEANKLNLIVLYCGFLGVTKKFIDNIKEESLIFLHTGYKDLKKTFESLIDKTNILLDLSYTISRYTDNDKYIKYLFNNFYDRICIGSDHPEVSLSELRERFDFFAKDLLIENAQKIASKNILQKIRMAK